VPAPLSAPLVTVMMVARSLPALKRKRAAAIIARFVRQIL
jgi:hypothetical protein